MSEFYERFQIKCKALNLSEAKDFWQIDLNASSSGFAELARTVIVLENEWDKNRVFLDIGLTTLPSYHTTSEGQLALKENFLF